MKFSLTVFTAILLLTSCSFPTHSIHYSIDTQNQKSTQLKNIVINTFGSQRFSGLIGIIRKNDGFHYILLDATGIKLLEVEVNTNGNFTVKKGIQKLRESSLPQILAQSLQRIYNIEPLELPCSSHILQQLCRKKLDDGEWIKYSLVGPFTHWKVHFSNGDDHMVTFSRPWLGLSLTLTDVTEE